MLELNVPTGRTDDGGVRVIGINPGPVSTERMVRLMKRRARPAEGRT